MDDARRQDRPPYFPALYDRRSQPCTFSTKKIGVLSAGRFVDFTSSTARLVDIKTRLRSRRTRGLKDRLQLKVGAGAEGQLTHGTRHKVVGQQKLGPQVVRPLITCTVMLLMSLSAALDLYWVGLGGGVGGGEVWS